MESEKDSFEALLEQSEGTALKKISAGQKVVATVVGIDNETVFLDVGTKSEGVIDASEFIGEAGELSVSIGDSVEVYCLKTGPGGQFFTSRIGSGASSAHLEEAWRSAVPVEGLVKSEIKGGFELTLSGNVRAFCPYSQMGLRRVDNAAEEYLDTRLTVLITKFEAGGKNIVVSARAHQEEERRQKREVLQETLEEGHVAEGVITSIQPFGLFVDIGGVDGLVPISEVGWSRVDNLQDIYRVGQQVKTIVKSLDWEKNRIGLSIKETLEDPWEQAIKDFSEGSLHTGLIARLAPFGAFVTLAPGVDGLVHVSKLGQGRKINHPREVVEAGQNIDVIIESIDPENRKISLKPSDYVSSDDEAEKESQDFRTFRSSQKKGRDNDGVSTFGALLKAKLDEKER